MRASILSSLALTAAISCIGVAQAEPQSNATSTITITIPPIAEAMEAEAAGASGAWTVSSQGRGFMVGIVTDTSADNDATEQLAVVSGDLSRVNVHVTANGAVTGLEGRIAETEGALTTYFYSLPPGTEHDAGAKTQILFSAI